MEGIKIIEIDITDWLIKRVYEAKHMETEQRFLFNSFGDVIEFELKHKDFDFFIDFHVYESDLIYPELEDEKEYDCVFKKRSHVSDTIKEVNFDYDRIEEIYKAVLTKL